MRFGRHKYLRGWWFRAGRFGASVKRWPNDSELVVRFTWSRR